MLPLNGSKKKLKGGIYRGLVYATSHNYPLIMAFNVQENAVFIHEFSKKSPYHGRGKHPPPSPPRSLRSLALAPPPPPVEKSWLRPMVMIVQSV